jgi:hypothetical protein
VNAASYFSQSYAEARGRFTAEARGSAVRLSSMASPRWRGIHAEALSIDVAWFGPEAPAAVVIVTSGTHGVEGFAGSAFQCWYAAEARRRVVPQGVAVVLVHAINPHGFSYCRRVNEDNVDLNRNFVDFRRPRPSAPEYSRLHGAIVPAKWVGDERRHADSVLRDAWESLGMRGFQNAVCRGQYDHPDGLFFGGRKPSWSNTVWRGWVARLPQSIEFLAHIDIHTGLGPLGYGELLYTLPRNLAAADLARECYEGMGVRVAGDTDSAATPVAGTINHSLIEANSTAAKMSISIEFGTVKFRRMFDALRADNWWNNHASPEKPGAVGVREELVNCFYPSSDEWRRSVLERSEEVLARTITYASEHVKSGRFAARSD